MQQTSPLLVDYVISSVLPFGPWLIVGSPFNTSLAVCRADGTAALPSGKTEL